MSMFSCMVDMSAVDFVRRLFGAYLYVVLSQFNILCVTDMVVVARFHGKYVAQHGRVYDSRRRSSGTITLS